jgi:hypothetical protein
MGRRNEKNTEAGMGHRNEEIRKQVCGTGMKRYGSMYLAPE